MEKLNESLMGKNFVTIPIATYGKDYVVYSWQNLV